MKKEGKVQKRTWLFALGSSLLLGAMLLGISFLLEEASRGRLVRIAERATKDAFPAVDFYEGRRESDGLVRFLGSQGLEGRISEHAGSDPSWVSDRAILFESVYVPEPSPYPGAITRQIVCPEEFLPEQTEYSAESGEGVGFFAYAGERFNYGVCAPDLVGYNVTYLLWRCADSRAYELWAFSTLARGNLSRSLESAVNLSCT